MIVFNGNLKTISTVSSFFRKMSFYAVANGHKIGIYKTWSDCEAQVKGAHKAKYKKFKTQQQAEDFIKEFGGSAGQSYLQNLSSTQQNSSKQLDQKNESKKPTNDFWPESSEDDCIQNDEVTDEDLLNALYEVEGLPQKPSSSNPLKRKATVSSVGGSKVPCYESNVLKVTGYIYKGEYEFPIDDEGFVIVYTDGSCINNGQANSSAGFGVYFGKNHPLNTAKPVIGRVTNNVGEIQAATHAIQIARDLGIDRLCICTDSQFLINAVTCWISGWKRKHWRLKNGEPVKNVVDFKVLDLLLEDKQITVKWNYVKGHASIEGNDMADKLAREGSAEYARLNPKK